MGGVRGPYATEGWARAVVTEGVLFGLIVRMEMGGGSWLVGSWLVGRRRLGFVTAVGWNERTVSCVRRSDYLCWRRFVRLIVVQDGSRRY